MEKDEENPNGMMSRHPLRTAGMAMIAGTAIGAGLAKVKKDRRSSLQKIRDQLNDVL